MWWEKFKVFTCWVSRAYIESLKYCYDHTILRWRIIRIIKLYVLKIFGKSWFCEVNIQTLSLEIWWIWFLRINAIFQVKKCRTHRQRSSPWLFANGILVTHHIMHHWREYFNFSIQSPAFQPMILRTCEKAFLDTNINIFKQNQHENVHYFVLATLSN